jgi:hypothetical protein
VICGGPEDSVPDGMTIDTEGMLWVAIWGGACVRRYNWYSPFSLPIGTIPILEVCSRKFPSQLQMSRVVVGEGRRLISCTLQQPAKAQTLNNTQPLVVSLPHTTQDQEEYQCTPSQKFLLEKTNELQKISVCDVAVSFWAHRNSTRA